MTQLLLKIISYFVFTTATCDQAMHWESPFLLPFTGFSQTEKDYQDVMAKMIRFYNSGQIDSLNTLVDQDFSEWDHEVENRLKASFGKIEWYKFMLIDSTDLDTYSRPMAYFVARSEKVHWGSKINAMALSLTTDKKISGTRS